MKFESLEQFINANTINRMKWLREASSEDIATAMKFNKEFAIGVSKTLGKEAVKNLEKCSIGNYEEALNRLISIKFNPGDEIKPFAIVPSCITV